MKLSPEYGLLYFFAAFSHYHNASVMIFMAIRLGCMCKWLSGASYIADSLLFLPLLNRWFIFHLFATSDPVIGGNIGTRVHLCTFYANFVWSRKTLKMDGEFLLLGSMPICLRFAFNFWLLSCSASRSSIHAPHPELCSSQGKWCIHWGFCSTATGQTGSRWLGPWPWQLQRQRSRVGLSIRVFTSLNLSKLQQDPLLIRNELFFEWMNE